MHLDPGLALGSNSLSEFYASLAFIGGVKLLFRLWVADSLEVTVAFLENLLSQDISERHSLSFPILDEKCA